MRPGADRRRRIRAGGSWVPVVSLTLAFAPGLAHADPPKTAQATPAPSAPSEQAAEAHQHAARARELYQQGAYRESITELEAALKFDPNGKDLVFNLGIVHEKLGDIDDALRYYARYQQMDLSPAERAKAEAYVKRLQGARHEVAKPETPPQQPPPPPPPPPPQAPPQHGRIDVFTVAAAVVGVGGIVTGSVLGVKALGDHPKSGVVTGSGESYSTLQSSVTTAHNEAIGADVAFGIGAAGVVATAVLFFARTRDSGSAAVSAGSAAPPVVISCTPLRGGGALVLGARFE